MNRLLIAGGDVCQPPDMHTHCSVLIEAGKIVAVGQQADAMAGAGIETIDATGLLLAPGFIDLQLNGGYGHNFTENPASIPLVAGRLLETGVTAFLPTIITAPMSCYAEAIRETRRVAAAGARVLGLHFEGPYLNPVRAGAHNRRWLRSPVDADMKAWDPLDAIRLVTLAPELPGADAMIARLLDAGVVVSAGHSDVTFEQASAGFEAGVRYVTHLFNAMRPLHHREPGLIGAALADVRVWVGLIVDGVHLHRAAVDLAWKSAGPERVTLVTDAMAAQGEPVGQYRIGGQDVVVNEDEGTVRLANGTLAGSVLTMDRAVRNLIQFTGCSIGDAIAAASTTPAIVLGLDGVRGRVVAGYNADLVFLTPDLYVAGTMVAGEMAFQSSAFPRIAVA